MEPMVCGAVLDNPYITAIEGAGAKGLIVFKIYQVTVAAFRICCYEH